MQPIDPRHLNLLRSQVLSFLDWGEAHVTFDAAVEGIPPDRYGEKHPDLPYSLWQLLEHMRLSQRDILEFCRNPDYVQPTWPDDYWPEEAAPSSPMDWADSVASFRRDRGELKQLIEDTKISLLDLVPHGEGQTYLREVLLVADHTAYHLGQFVVLRRLMGLWD